MLRTKCPKQWSDKYKGKFDEGWDALRDKIIKQQKKLGVVPKDAELTKRHDEIPSWDDMPDDLKPVLARQMEIYAGFIEQTDHEVGRVVDAIDDLGVLDDTLIYYILGDNGASAEGTLNGCFNEMTTLNGMPGIETTEFLLSKIDDFGTPDAYNHYAVGWAHGLCAPYQWTKQVASHWGGTRNGTIVHWPKGLAGKGEVRNQFHHVIDVAPTILEAAGLPAPTAGQRDRPGAVGGRQHAGDAPRRHRARDAHRPVLRDDGQSRDLPRRLDRGDQTPHTVEGRHPASVRRRRVGTLRSRRLDAGTRLAGENPDETS